jgi:hypothetical protein
VETGKFKSCNNFREKNRNNETKPVEFLNQIGKEPLLLLFKSDEEDRGFLEQHKNECRKPRKLAGRLWKPMKKVKSRSNETKQVQCLQRKQNFKQKHNE